MLTSISGKGAYLQCKQYLYELTCTSSSCDWSVMEQQLKKPVQFAVMMYLPTDYTSILFSNETRDTCWIKCFFWNQCIIYVTYYVTLYYFKHVMSRGILSDLCKWKLLDSFLCHLSIKRFWSYLGISILRRNQVTPMFSTPKMLQELLSSSEGFQRIPKDS